MSRVVLNSISYIHSNGNELFKNLTFAFNNERTGITGVNGSGKTMLAKIILGSVAPSVGNVIREGSVLYLPQDTNSFNDKSILEIFSVKEKLEAHKRIISGIGSEDDLLILDDDWQIEERIKTSLESTGISYIDPERIFSTLSGGEKVRSLLASILVQNPEFIILDEPTNHLDLNARKLIYDFVSAWKKGMIIISHDRKLLRLMNRIAELSSSGLKAYGGNYDFYIEQSTIENIAVQNQVRSAEVELKKSLQEKQRTLQKQEKRISSAAKGASGGGTPKIVLNALRGKGEDTLKKLKDVHDEKIEQNRNNLSDAKSRLKSDRQIKIDIDESYSPASKIIVRAEEINFSYDQRNNLWKRNLSFEIMGSERILLSGSNGSGKTTLMRMILKQLKPVTGKLYVGVSRIGILDQHVSILKDDWSLLDNLKLHADNLPEHELRIRLGRFLFYKDTVHKKAGMLSGGERMRAGLACLLASDQSPEMIMLDEPTNNLDLNSIEELTTALNNFKGTLLVVTHDETFAEDIRVQIEIGL